jgi:hypothetical protein
VKCAAKNKAVFGDCDNSIIRSKNDSEGCSTERKERRRCDPHAYSRFRSFSITSPRHGRACPGHPRLAGLAPKKDVDARDTSAFTRVFDALCAGMTTERLAQLQL